MDRLLGLMMTQWQRLNAETLQYMRMLDFWIMFILVLLIWMIKQSRVDGYHDFTVWAAILGAVATVWIGRVDVLIHRPVPASINIEREINLILVKEVDSSVTQKIIDDLKLDPIFKTWENYYKPRLGRGVKVLVPLDALVGIFIFALFVHANNAAYQYLKESWYAGYFWWSCIVVHFIGWGIIASAKWLAE